MVRDRYRLPGWQTTWMILSKYVPYVITYVSPGGQMVILQIGYSRALVITTIGSNSLSI